MKKGFRGTGTVERVDFTNKGIAVTDDGDRVIVKNTIPGQKVEFVVNKVKHQRAEGRLMEVIEKSPLETEEPCPHFGMCGGCTYQTVPYEKQLDMKLTQVKKLISDAIGTEKEANRLRRKKIGDFRGHVRCRIYRQIPDNGRILFQKHL